MELPKEVQEAKAKGAVLELTGEDGKNYYFHKPGKQEMDRYLAAAAKGKISTAANNLVMETAVFPDKATLKTMFAERPGLMVAINNALQNAVGINEEFEVKKL